MDAKFFKDKKRKRGNEVDTENLEDDFLISDLFEPKTDDDADSEIGSYLVGDFSASSPEPTPRSQTSDASILRSPITTPAIKPLTELIKVSMDVPSGKEELALTVTTLLVKMLTDPECKDNLFDCLFGISSAYRDIFDEKKALQNENESLKADLKKKTEELNDLKATIAASVKKAGAVGSPSTMPISERRSMQSPFAFFRPTSSTNLGKAEQLPIAQPVKGPVSQVMTSPLYGINEILASSALPNLSVPIPLYRTPVSLPPVSPLPVLNTLLPSNTAISSMLLLNAIRNLNDTQAASYRFNSHQQQRALNFNASIPGLYR